MNNSNLPPGVSESMIPGNRPEDEDDEKFWDEIHDRCVKAGTPGLVEPVVFLGDESDPIWKMLNVVRDLAYTIGFQEGRAEAQIDEAARMMEEQDGQT